MSLEVSNIDRIYKFEVNGDLEPGDQKYGLKTPIWLVVEGKSRSNFDI